MMKGSLTTIGRGGTPNGMSGRRSVLRGVRPAFTLVEVLATVVLMGIVLPVAMRGISIALAAASNSRHVAEASALADSQLNQLVAEGINNIGDSSGDFSPDHPEYRWTCQTAARDYG